LGNVEKYVYFSQLLRNMNTKKLDLAKNFLLWLNKQEL